MPVARNVWQPILTRVPRSAARRWIIRQASTRFIGFSVNVPVRPTYEVDFHQQLRHTEAVREEAIVDHLAVRAIHADNFECGAVADEVVDRLHPRYFAVWGLALQK